MKYEEKGAEIGAVVEKKNRSYGDSFRRGGELLKIFYPNGIEISQYDDMLAMIRVIDKLFRIASQKEAFGECPWEDICGYAILKSVQDEEKKK